MADFKVYGAIYDKWIKLGGKKFASPMTDETGTPDGVGRYNHFTDGKSIYWTPSTGAHLVYGAIRKKWADLGWETSSLRYPTSDEMPAADGVGRISTFQGGTIYWSPNTGAIVLGPLAWHDNIVTGGLAALGGNYQITFFQNGDFTFSGHMHNSGSDNYDSQLAVAIVDGLGNAYTLEHKGHTSGTFFPGSRDDNWEIKGNNPAIAANWGQLQVAKYARVFNYDSDIADAVKQAVNAALEAAAKAAVKAIIQLV